MSATLEAEPVAKYLGGCPVLVSEGKAFPVEIRYADLHGRTPGFRASRGFGRANHSFRRRRGTFLFSCPEWGKSTRPSAPAARPGRANAGPDSVAWRIAAGGAGRWLSRPIALRKVVVATNVAETSVTIDGIIHVIDSGLARVARYEAERGIGTLFIEPISRASAEQRAGRAGRTAPGVCHRLWTESAHLNRPERNTPEIQRSDLAEVVLLLHSFGIKDAAQFDWLDKPDPQAVERAEKLLRILGALRPAGRERRKDRT